MFEDSTFHSSRVLPDQTPKWMLLALAVNLSVLSALVALPLIYPQGLPAQLLQRALYLPSPPMAAQPQPHPTQAASGPASALRNPFAAPPSAPPLISTDPVGPPPAAIGMDNPAGEIPGAVGAGPIFRSDPPKVVQTAQQPQRIAVTGGVTEGLLIRRTTPVYPAIARTAGISGTIVLAATISKTGVIENLRVLSGPMLLRQAAIEAVQNWRYRPYLLNNQPVEVETTVNVVFSMSGR
jgi:protein TonB